MTPQRLEAAWQETADRAGLADLDAVFQDLRRRLSEPGRAYHTLDHIAAMLDTVSDFGDAVQDNVSVRLAVWFHDAVYDSRRSDNEEQSAAYAAEVLSGDGVPPSIPPVVKRLVLATKTHQAPPEDTDGQIFSDADLAILGTDAEEYDRYARAIREEYAWVPEADYRAGRRRVLEGFLGRSRIYATDLLFGRREQAARVNLRREIEWLMIPPKP